MKIWTRIGLLTLTAGLVAATLTISAKKSEPRNEAMAPWPTVQATENDALGVARKSGKPVEVGSAGGEKTTLLANPNGTFTQQHHSQPIRAWRGGKWVPIDTTLVRFGNGRIGPKATSMVMSFSGGGSGPFATVGHKGQQLSLAWLGVLPAPVLSGSSATYPSVLTDVDLVVNADNEGFSHILVVKTPEAASRLTQIQLGLQIEGLKLRAENNRLIATDGNGTKLFEAPAPKMWDAGDGTGEPSRGAPESAKRAEMGLRITGDRMILTPDAAMMAGNGVRFPLYLDPFVRGTSRYDWTMVDSGYPYEEYWHWSSAGGERIGYCPGHSGCNSSLVKRLLWTFDTTYYQSSSMDIISAEFAVPMRQAAYPGESHNAELWLLNGGIDAGTIWTYQPGWAAHLSSNSSTNAVGDCNTSPAPNQSFPAKYAIDLRYSWITLGLKDQYENNHRATKRYCNNATLSVNFNRKPNAPTNLAANPSGACKTAAPYPYADLPPTLSAYVSDGDTEDGEPLTVEWSVAWSGGSKVWYDSSAKGNGSTFYYPLNDAVLGVPNLPENTVISWNIRAHDGTSWGPTSDTCGFMLDRSSPTGPDIDSPEYLPLDAAGSGEPSPNCVPDSVKRDGVGRPGTFTFKSSHTDVVSYQYTISSPIGTSVPWTTINVAAGAAATASWMPEAEGPHVVTARAIDQAGRTNGVDSTCTFVVKEGRPSIAAWGLADAEGSTQAVDAVGDNANPAISGGGVTFGAVGPDAVNGRAATFTGSGTSYLSPAKLGLVDTSRYFSVSAWVRLEPGNETRNQAVLSQDGTGETGFTLGYDGSSKKWYFFMPTSDGIAFSGTSVSSAVAAHGVWTHLVAVYNPAKQEMSLLVNGEASYTAGIRTSWASQRQFQIGRRMERTGYGNYLRGSIAEVAVYDRIVPRSEAVRLAAVRKGYWNFNVQTTPNPAIGYDVSPEYSDNVETSSLGRAMGLRDGASLYLYDPAQFPPPEGPPSLMGTGHLLLDTAAEYASSTVGARTDQSFTVTARVQLSSVCDAAKPKITVLSQPGTNASAFAIRCVLVGTTPRWQAYMATGDVANATMATVLTDRAPTTGAPGQHLALVFDSMLRDLRLYVDGQLAGSVQLDGTHVVWNATADGLQVGRAKVNGAWAEDLPGNVDDVRVYAGVLTATEIAQIADLTELPNN